MFSVLMCNYGKMSFFFPFPLFSHQSSWHDHFEDLSFTLMSMWFAFVISSYDRPHWRTWAECWRHLPRVQIFSIPCSFWGTLAKSYLAPPGGWRLHFGEIWIHHWAFSILKHLHPGNLRSLLCSVSTEISSHENGLSIHYMEKLNEVNENGFN